MHALEIAFLLEIDFFLCVMVEFLWYLLAGCPAVVSGDHAHGNLCVEHMVLTKPDGATSLPGPHLFSRDEIRQHNQAARDGSRLLVVVDSYVVNASGFSSTHPGGLRALQVANSATVGATPGQAFGFSLSRGRYAHTPDTGKRFREGVKRFWASVSDKLVLSPVEVTFPPYNKIVILGRLEC
mmetsp:Transcript_30976/g.51338  ORF Transcript_30976/g.51338 Transcript_30976/m.51338 type:complete len:182 (+) Transcript_30976:2-547(+)